MFTQNFVKIFHSVQEIGLFSLFQNLKLGNASANPKWYVTVSWATSCRYAKFYQNIPNGFKSYQHFRHLSRTGWRHFPFFRIWTSAAPRPIPNDIWQSLGLHLVNINAYAKFYKNIPNGLRVIEIFRHFSQTGRRQIFTNCPVTKSNVWL